MAFSPTYLYIKQHTKTGLKYFGKTTEKDPVVYPGSGFYWKSHLAKHGNDVTTLWAQLFTNRDELIEEALSFSRSHDIVKSKEWANLIPENGLAGWTKGQPRSEETKLKHRGRITSDSTREKMKGRITSEETRQKLSLANKGKPKKPFSDEHKQKLSESGKGKMKGRNKSEETKQKMSIAHKERPRKPHSEETKQKLSEAGKRARAKKILLDFSKITN